MRLRSLTAHQVGLLQGSEPLHLPLSPRVTVILGDNEAGKSTLRRAIRALLFGPTKNLVAPVPSVAQFSLEAEVEHDAGTTTIHRKGRGLQEALPDTLAELLNGDAKVGRFTDLFDLTHDNLLPKEAPAFLRAEGALGSLMFGAATGISPAQLQQARQSVTTALSTMNSRAAGKQEIPYWKGRYKEAQARHGELARFKASNAADDRLNAAEAEVERLDGELSTLDREHRRVERLLSSVGDVERLDYSSQQLERLVESGDPPVPVTVAKLAQDFQRVQDCAAAVEEATTALKVAAGEREAAEPPGELYSLSPQIEALRDGVATCSADRRRLRELREKQANAREGLLQTLERLGIAADDVPEQTARDLLRPDAEVKQLRALAQARVSLESTVAHKQQQRDAAVFTLSRLESEMGDPSELPTGAFDAVGASVKKACDAEEEIERLLAEQAEAAPLEQRQLAALRLSASAPAPKALALPTADEAKAADAALGKAFDTSRACDLKFSQLQEEERQLRDALSTLRQQVGNVASAEDVAKARQLRDRRLQGLRERLAAGDASLPELAVDAEELQQLIRQSDLLVDRRAEVGEALGQLRADEARAQALEARIADAQAKLELAAQGVAEREQAVAELWPFLDRPPASASDWFRAHELWRASREAGQQRAARLEQLRNQMDSARQDVLATLASALPELKELGSARAIREAVGRERERRLTHNTRIKALHDQRREAESTMQAARKELKAAEDALSGWQEKWRTSAQTLPPELGVQSEGVERWLELHEELRRTLASVGRLDKDAADCARSVAEGEGHIASLLQEARALEPTLDVPEGLDPVVAFGLLDSACKKSGSRRDRLNALAAEHDRAQRALDGTSDRLCAARDTLDQAWNQVGVQEECTAEVLEALKQRSQAVQEVREQMARIHAVLSGRWGDGVHAAVEEVRSVGKAALEARLQDVKKALEQTRVKRDAVANERRDAETAIEAMQHAVGATQVTQDLADARANLFNKLVERVRMQATAFLLEQAHRKASDGGEAIESEGSKYFNALTGGAWKGLCVDYGDSANPQLLAVDSTGKGRPLEELSVGTRDQVWLALRLAGIVQAAKETPFPLLLDDSLVQFDDVRAEAALRLLHRISEHVQVILFTHHDHLAALAQSALPPEDLAIVPLPEVSGAMRIRAARREPAARIPRPVLEGAADPESYEESAPQERRGRRDASGGLEEAKQQILDVLHGADAPMGKAEILAAATDAGLDLEAGWTAAIRALVDEGVVIQEGQKRGARYQLR